MKTTREILQIIDVMNARMSIFRRLTDFSTSRDPMWQVAISADRDGVKIEVASQSGFTFDEALAKAWAKFEPAVHEGLPVAAIEPPRAVDPGEDPDAPRLEDAEFEEIY